MKKLETLLLLCFFILFFSNSSLIAEISVKILSFWFEELVPSMFLCILLIQLLSSTSFFIQLSKPFRFLCPLLQVDHKSLGLIFSCLFIGAPSSTILINQAISQHQITQSMGKRLLNCVSVSTISFLIMSAGTGMLKSQKLGVLLWLIQILSCFILLGCTRKTPVMFQETDISAQIKKHPLKSALFQTGSVLFLIGGYLLIFQALAQLISLYLPPSIKPFLQIISEFSYGCRRIADQHAVKTAFVLMSALCGFNGFCVQFQSLSMSDTRIPGFQYFCFRCIQSLLSYLMALAAVLLLLE